jgi:hypothetical protein
VTAAPTVASSLFLEQFRQAAQIALAIGPGMPCAELAVALYGGWYAGASPAGASAPKGFPTDLVAVLRAAHAANERWEQGWTVERVGPGGMVEVARAGERRVLYRSDYVATIRPGLLPRVGDEVIATARRDRVDPDRAWWRTCSPTWSDALPPSGLLRLYWNVEIGHLPALVRRLSALLDGLDGPWMFKCAADPAVHTRADATVLYLRREEVLSLATDLEAIRSGLGPHMRAEIPPFTLAVGPGLAVAEDPGTGESFGEHRCRLIAEAVAPSTDTDLENATAFIVARFSAEGIDASRPYAMGPGPLPWETRP